MKCLCCYRNWHKPAFVSVLFSYEIFHAYRTIYNVYVCLCIKTHKTSIPMPNSSKSEYRTSPFESSVCLPWFLAAPPLGLFSRLWPGAFLFTWWEECNPNTFLSTYYKIMWSTCPFPRRIPQQAWASDVDLKVFKAWTLTRNPNIKIGKSWAFLVEVGRKSLFLCLFALSLKPLCGIHKSGWQLCRMKCKF